MLVETIFVIACYLLGSVPFMILLAGWHGFKVSPTEDLHIAIWSKLGAKAGILGVLFDIIVKGVVPVVIGSAVGFSLAWVLAGAVASVAGQMWPVFRRFDGEKGNTVSLGLFLTLIFLYRFWPLLIIRAPAGAGAAMKILPGMLGSQKRARDRLTLGKPGSRSLPVGIMLGFLLMPLTSWAFGLPPEVTIGLGALNVIIFLRRLTAEGVRKDIRESGKPGMVLLNRFLYDRSFV